MNTETEGHIKLGWLPYIRVLLRARYRLSNRWGGRNGDSSPSTGYIPKDGSEPPSGRGSTGCADVVFRASSPALVQSRIGLLDGQVVPATILSGFFA